MPKELYTEAQGLPLHCCFSGPSDLLTRDAPPLAWGIAPSPLGPLLAVWLQDALWRLCFAPEQQLPDQTLETALRPCPPPAAGSLPPADHQRAARLMTRIFSGESTPPLRLRLEGTPFQCRVWHALLHVPKGQTVSYGDLAQRAGYPQAARAVGTAMAQNPIVFLVPCHRVIRAGGQSGNYGGGAALKARLLDWERRSPRDAPMPRLY